MVEWWKQQPLRGKFAVVLPIALVVLIGIGAALEGEEEAEPVRAERKAPVVREAPPPEPEVSAEMVVDLWEETKPGELLFACHQVEEVSEQIVWAGFRAGYKGAEGPGAREVFDEIMGRC